MAVHRLISLQIILLLWLIKASGRQLCRDRCGGVSISYPFGIGEGCYFDRTYEVICSNSSGSEIAFLNSIKLELSSVGHLTSEIGVSISVISLNSSNSTSNAKSVNLSGTPFSFSNDTRFTAIGCENLSMINNLNNNDSKDSGACLSICSCDPSQSRHAGCCDLSCTITPNSKVFDANTVYNYSQSIPQSCKSISMVYQGWLFSRYQTNSSGLRDEEQLPALLKWGRIKGKCQVDFNSYSKSCNSDNYCLIQLGSGHFCLCDAPRAASYQHICQGDLICNTTSDYNCSQCPSHNYQDPSAPDQGSCSISISPPIVEPFGKISQTTLIFRGCIIGGLGVLFLIIVTWRLYIFVKRRREMKLKQNFFKRNGGLLLQQELSSNEGNIDKTKVFTSKELDRATDNFNANRILGQGGQGTVYKGMLVDGRIVAVKKSKVVVDSKVEEFINEVVILSQINHRNVVKLLGCCLETQVPLLVYEFVPNGTLFEYVHDQNQEFPITWEMRLRIAVEVSDALSYLHSAASIPIYHRDIKSTNILLDDKYRAKVSDFGTSRSMPVDQTHLTTQVQGTFGYLDPEYFRSSQFTDKSDVYSFGVVLAELLTGEKAIRSINSEENRSLAAYFLSAMKENRLFEILDAHVLKEGEKNEIITVAKLANRCLNLNGKKRPTMRELAIELARIRAWNNVASMKEESLEEIVSAEEDIASRHFNAGSSVTGSDSATFSMDFDPLISNRWG